MQTLAHVAQHVQIRKSRLHHYHVSTLRNVNFSHTNAFFPVRRVHLVRTPVTMSWRRIGGIAKRPIKAACVLRGVRHDAHVRKFSLVKSLSNGSHVPVHHIGRRHHVRTGLCVTKRFSRQPLKCCVVIDIARRRQFAAMTVACVFAHAHVGNHKKFRVISANLSHGALSNTIFVVSLRATFILVIWQPKQQNSRNTQRFKFAQLAIEHVKRILKHARHRLHFSFYLFALAHEQRIDEIAHAEFGFANHLAHFGAGTHATRTI